MACSSRCRNLTHRGAVGADRRRRWCWHPGADSDRFFREESAGEGATLLLLAILSATAAGPEAELKPQPDIIDSVIASEGQVLLRLSRGAGRQSALPSPEHRRHRALRSAGCHRRGRRRGRQCRVRRVGFTSSARWFNVFLRREQSARTTGSTSSPSMMTVVDKARSLLTRSLVMTRIWPIRDFFSWPWRRPRAGPHGHVPAPASSRTRPHGRP